MPPPAGGAVVVPRRQIIRSCKARGWTVQPDALQAMEDALALRPLAADRDSNGSSAATRNADANTALSTLLDALQQHMKASHSRTVTVQVWNDLIDSDASHETGTTRGSSGSSNTSTSTSTNMLAVASSAAQFSAKDIQVFDAFDTPKLVFEVMRRQFQVLNQTWSLFGTAEEKVRA